MVDIVLTEDQRTQCSMQTLDLITKAAVAGAIACVLWHTFVKEQIVGRDLPARMLRGFGSKIARRFGGSQ